MKKKVLLVTLLLASAGTAKVYIVGRDPNGREYKIEYSSRDETDEMVEKILRTQDENVSELIRALAEPDAANMRKVKIIYALGGLRAFRATTILIKNINLVAEQPDMKVGIGRWGQYPAREALVKIGPYASTMIVEIIASAKFDRAKVDGYAAVIAEIERPRYALMKLDDWIAGAEDETVRGRYEVVKARIKQLAIEEEGKGTRQAMQDDAKEEKRKEEWLDPLEGLLSEEAWVRDQAVASLLQGHGQTVADLIALVDRNNANKYSDQTRSVVAYLLGEFRAVKSLVDKVTSADADAQKKAIRSVLRQRKELVRALCEVVDQNDAARYSWEPRAAAAYLLGELGAAEGVVSLSRALGQPRPDEFGHNKKVIGDYPPPHRSPWAVFNALVKIGRPAVPAMIENIERSDNKLLRRGSLDVLNRVLGGKRRVLELLTKLKARAKKDKDEKRIERIEAALKRVQKHYKEDKEPLY